MGPDKKLKEKVDKSLLPGTYIQFTTSHLFADVWTICNYGTHTTHNTGSAENINKRWAQMCQRAIY